MSYEIVLPSSFLESIRRLKKKYPHANADAQVALNVILQNPFLGVVIPGGHGVRKLRVRSSDLQRGKSGGFRLIYLLEGEQERIYPLLMYAKTEQADVTRRELQELLDALTRIE
ncbi:MAG: type II toxin-antitoxin system RelE/ParE family toxin [Chloroflexi bacterium]|nr:type II toxin-antitoxin system RelE/ParE family toxin [Chloroflexota bacterium]